MSENRRIVYNVYVLQIRRIFRIVPVEIIDTEFNSILERHEEIFADFLLLSFGQPNISRMAYRKEGAPNKVLTHSFESTPLQDGDKTYFQKTTEK